MYTTSEFSPRADVPTPVGEPADDVVAADRSPTRTVEYVNGSVSTGTGVYATPISVAPLPADGTQMAYDLLHFSENASDLRWN